MAQDLLRFLNPQICKRLNLLQRIFHVQFSVWHLSQRSLSNFLTQSHGSEHVTSFERLRLQLFPQSLALSSILARCLFARNGKRSGRSKGGRRTIGVFERVELRQRRKVLFGVCEFGLERFPESRRTHLGVSSLEHPLAVYFFKVIIYLN